MLTEGRTLNFILNLYRFALTIGILVAEEDGVYWLMLSSVFVLLPNCMLGALKFNVMLGRAMNITDVDLFNALNIVGLGFIMEWLYKATGARRRVRDLASEEGTEILRESQTPMGSSRNVDTDLDEVELTNLDNNKSI